MSELIDRQALREKMYHEAFESDTDMQRWDSGCWIRYKMFENAVNDAPTIDAVPVRHGEWEQVEVIDYDGISMNDDAVRCTVCGHVEQSVYWARTYYHYCPNCAARMDGERREG